ncbi:hypothetical protein AVEN_215062-1 [Araneus ventricosus]|uniref:Uncharacterized protein n=1 Tax=Araneus ventricosus TaxID=182803 RepID=A0A4Y2HLL1_ARAVE|nr:hypothetical protein AVEN_215062-1 [Araneus ventricosus]
MTRTTPELEPLLQTSKPHERLTHDIIFNVHMDHIHDGSSVLSPDTTVSPVHPCIKVQGRYPVYLQSPVFPDLLYTYSPRYPLTPLYDRVVDIFSQPHERLTHDIIFNVHMHHIHDGSSVVSDFNPETNQPQNIPQDHFAPTLD